MDAQPSQRTPSPAQLALRKRVHALLETQTFLKQGATTISDLAVAVVETQGFADLAPVYQRLIMQAEAEMAEEDGDRGSLESQR